MMMKLPKKPNKYISERMNKEGLILFEKKNEEDKKMYTDKKEKLFLI